MPDWFTFNFQPLELSNQTPLGRRVTIYRMASIIRPTTKYLWQTFQTHLAAVLKPSSTALKTLPTSPAGLSPAVGWNRPATRMGAPHLTHLCVHGPPARLCETNSLFSSSGARSRLRGGGGIVQHYQDNGAIWGTEGSPARLFSVRQTAQHIMCGSGHLRVTFFSITTDDKGKVILFPFQAIIGKTRGGGEIYGLWTMPLFGQHTDDGLGRDNGPALCSSNQHHVKGGCSLDLWILATLGHMMSFLFFGFNLQWIYLKL